MRLTLLGDEKAKLTKRYSENGEAYQLYMRARYYWNKRTEEDLNRAIEYFNQAVAHDTEYALAYAGLAQAFILVPQYSGLPTREWFERGRAAAEKALGYDTDLSDGYAVLAQNAYNQYDWKKGEEYHKRAISLNPNNPTIHQWYATFFIWMGRMHEAEQESYRARVVDPLSLAISMEEGAVPFYAHRYDEAIEAFEKAVELNQNFGVAHQ